MPRRARIIIPGVAHHIVQRGNNKQNVLQSKEDFRNYCYWMNQYCIKYDVSIIAYCLMTNHVHLIAIPSTKIGLARLFNTVHMRYAQYFNFKRKTCGHLWQSRFYSCVLDEKHLFYAIRYVEQNPVRAKMVRHPWDYNWSSAKWHVGANINNFIKVKNTSIIDKSDWKRYLINSDESMDERLRHKTQRGIALADDDFIGFWEDKLKCLLRELKPGRKKAETEK